MKNVRRCDRRSLDLVESLDMMCDPGRMCSDTQAVTIT
jgi:hypothetical protein